MTSPDPEAPVPDEAILRAYDKISAIEASYAQAVAQVARDLGVEPDRVKDAVMWRAMGRAG